MCEHTGYYTRDELAIEKLMLSIKEDYPQFAKNAVKLEGRFARCVAALRRKRDDHEERARLDLIYDDLEELCFAIFHISFQDWCKQVSGDELAEWKKEPQCRYVGSQRTLQEGTLHIELLKALNEGGINLQEGRKVQPEDLLVRYRAVPLHSYWLYTPLDFSMQDKFLKYSATIDCGTTPLRYCWRIAQG